MVTTIVERLGTQAAAEFTGRTGETILRHYKEPREARQMEIADRLLAAREEAMAGAEKDQRALPNRNPQTSDTEKPNDYADPEDPEAPAAGSSGV